jgi:hypothetical protein
MAPSTLFSLLNSRLDELGAGLLPALKADLTYTRAEYDRVRAYVLLVHAEVEAFLEQRVCDEVKRRMEDWEQARTPSAVLMGVLAFHRGEWTAPIESMAPHANGDKNPTWAARDIDSRLRLCHGQTNIVVKENNGIKSRDSLRMLLRIGFALSAIDEDLVDELDALGSDRGAFAHNSVRVVTNEPDPELTRKRVDHALQLLGKLDAAISALK